MTDTIELSTKKQYRGANLLKNRFFALFFLCYAIICSLPLLINYNLKLYGCLAIILVVSELLSFVVCDKKIWSPSFLFLMLFNLFHLGISIEVFLNLQKYSGLFSYGFMNDVFVTDSTMKKSFCLSLSSSALFCLSIHIPEKQKINLGRFDQENKCVLFNTSLFLMIFSFIPFVLTEIFTWKAYLSDGYLAVYSISLPGILQVLGGLFYFGVLMFLTAFSTTAHNKTWFICFFALVLLLFLDMLKGTRIDSVIFLISLLYLFFWKLNSKRKRIVFACLGFVASFAFLTLLAFIAQYRVSGDVNIKNFFIFISSNGLVSVIAKTLAEFGSTIRSVFLAIEYVPSYKNYLFGFTYFADLTAVYPNTGNLLGSLVDYYSFVNRFPESTISALGGSILAEAYVNFGYIGSLVFLFFSGRGMAFVDSLLEKAFFEKSVTNVFFGLFLTICYISWVRGYFETYIFRGCFIVACFTSVAVLARLNFRKRFSLTKSHYLEWRGKNGK